MYSQFFRYMFCIQSTHIHGNDCKVWFWVKTEDSEMIKSKCNMQEGCHVIMSFHASFTCFVFDPFGCRICHSCKMSSTWLSLPVVSLSLGNAGENTWISKRERKSKNRNHDCCLYLLFLGIFLSLESFHSYFSPGSQEKQRRREKRRHLVTKRKSVIKKVHPFSLLLLLFLPYLPCNSYIICNVCAFSYPQPSLSLSPSSQAEGKRSKKNSDKSNI